MLSVTVKLPDVENLQFPGKARAEALRESGRAVQELVRSHLHSLPGRRYWKEAAESAQLTTNADSATITIAHRGAALHYYGGTVLPGKGTSSKTRAATKLLAIPQGTDEPPVMYGSPLAFVPIKGKPHLKGILLPGTTKQARRAYKGRPAGRTITVALPGAAAVYHLVDRTVHLPNPNVLPTPEQMADTAQQAVNDYINLVSHAV